MADDASDLPTPGSDVTLMKIEAKSAVREVSFAVDYVDISDKLNNSDERAYLNVRTKEGDVFCVELTVQGFRVSRNSIYVHARVLFVVFLYPQFTLNDAPKVISIIMEEGRDLVILSPTGQ